MATINDIGIPLPGGSGLGILQPKQKNKWIVQFVNIGTVTSSRDLSMQCITVSRPKLTFQKHELHRYNSVAWIAGKHSYEALQVTFQDNYSNTASATVQSQTELQQKLLGADSGLYLAAAPDANTYKFATKLQMLDGGTNVLEEIHYEGCFIESVDYGEMDYSTSEPVTISLTISFDNATQIFNIGGSTGQSLGGSAPITSSTTVG